MEFVPGFIEHIKELLVDIIFDPKHNLTCYHYCPTQYEKNRTLNGGIGLLFIT